MASCSETMKKYMWWIIAIVVILLAGIIGAVVYLVVINPDSGKEVEKEAEKATSRDQQEWIKKSETEAAAETSKQLEELQKKFPNVQEYQVASLIYHNKLRALHGVPPMEIDPALNEIGLKCAQHYEKIQTIDHSCPFKTLNGEKVGENLYMSKSQGSNGPVVPKGDDTQHSNAATRAWYEEISLYNYDKPGFSLPTGHFTAMIWKSVTKYGIGSYKTVNGVYVAAMYTPHPNVQGQFKEEVPKPIK